MHVFDVNVMHGLFSALCCTANTPFVLTGYTGSPKARRVSSILSPVSDNSPVPTSISNTCSLSKREENFTTDLAENNSDTLPIEPLISNSQVDIQVADDDTAHPEPKSL